MSKEQEILKENAGSEISDGELDKVAGGIRKDCSHEEAVRRAMEEEQEKMNREMESLDQQIERMKQEVEWKVERPTINRRQGKSPER